MSSFDKMLAEFAEKTGVKPNEGSANSFDVIADDVMVSAQYRPERDDCVIFSLPVYDQTPDERMLRRALELAADGECTGGHFLGMRDGMFVLSAVLPLDGLSAEDFAKRLLVLASASRGVADALQRTAADAPSGGEADPRLQSGGADFMPV